MPKKKSNIIIHRPTKKLFWAVSKKHPEEKEYQGIVFPDGHVEIGIDAWRQFDKHDCTSFDVYPYRDIYQFRVDWNIVPIRKGYFMANKKKEEWNGYSELSIGACAGV